MGERTLYENQSAYSHISQAIKDGISKGIAMVTIHKRDRIIGFESLPLRHLVWLAVIPDDELEEIKISNFRTS
jgi:hypothetical protein